MIKSTRTNMYDKAKSWNPFKGCNYDCIYCSPSFQRQAKRQKHLCKDCYTYTPHCHEERLSKIPSTPIVFACGDGDIAFCSRDFVHRIIDRIKKHNIRRPQKTYFFQSKKPACLEPFLSDFPDNVILLTTLETNRDADYRQISKAPPPSERYRQFRSLDYPRKVVTIEPVMDFDTDIFVEWIKDISPEYVWLGFNSKPESISLPEPSMEKLRQFVGLLTDAGIAIKGKTLRGLTIPHAA